MLVVKLRRMVLLPLDDLRAVTREFINADVSRSGLERCLRRHGVSDLKSLQPAVEDEPVPLKTFKDYEPGFVHIDIKYLPQMPDETQRRYLFAAIDRATCWVYFRIYRDQTEVSSTDFPHRLKVAAPMKKQISAALLACASGVAFTAPQGYVKVFESENGMTVFMHPDVRTMAISLESGRLPLNLVLADEWIEQGKGHLAQRTAYRCDSPGSSFMVLPALDGRLFRNDKPINAKRGMLGFATWDFACAKVRSAATTEASR